MSPTPKLVLTHSSYLRPLLPFLSRLSLHPSVSRLIPARLARSRGRPRGGFAVRVTVPTGKGWKMIARDGTSVQEVRVPPPPLFLARRARLPGGKH